MNYFKPGIMTVATIVLCSLTATAAYAAGVINLAPLQPPNPGWGQGTQFSIYVSENGKPAQKVNVKCWFSGQRGIQSGPWVVVTDNSGRATFTRTLPQWKREGRSNWVDLNASSDKVAALKYWRIK